MAKAILAKIYESISRSKENYNHGKDYYNSPVETELGIKTGQGLRSDWPFIRKEFLFDATDKLTKFPHNDIDHANERDRPVVMFYELMSFLDNPESEESKEIRNKLDPTGLYPTNFAQEFSKISLVFFNAYSYLLSRLIFRKNIPLDQLLESFCKATKDVDLLKGTGIEIDEYKLYIEKIYNKFKNQKDTRFFYFKNKVTNTQVRNKVTNTQVSDKKHDKEKYIRKANFYGPAFLARAVRLNLGENQKGVYVTTAHTKGIGIDINSEFIFAEVGGSLAYKNNQRFRLGIYCMTIECFFAKINSDAKSLSHNVLKENEELKKMNEELKKMNEELLKKLMISENAKPSTRFVSPNLPNVNGLKIWPLDGFIIDDKNSPECNSLHVFVPNTLELLDSAFEFNFIFFNKDHHELPFTFIESYDPEDDLDQSGEFYYFLPDRLDLLPPHYSQCGVSACIFQADDFTATVMVLVD